MVELEHKCIKVVQTGKPIADVKNNPRMHIPVFGNGDVDSPEKAMEMRDKYGLDGAMNWKSFYRIPMVL